MERCKKLCESWRSICFVYLLILLSCKTVLTVEPLVAENDWIVVGSEQIPLHRRHKRFVGDGDPPRFLSENYIVSESDGTLENLVCVLPGSETFEVAIFSAMGPQERCYRFPCPPARANSDFVPVDIFRVFLKPAETFCFDITILDDNRVDGREFFLLAVQDLRTLEIVDTTVVTINDDDDPSFTSSSHIIVSEDTGNARICVKGGKEDVQIKVEVLPQSSSASMSSTNPDFAINFVQGEEVLLKAGEEQCFYITIVDDEFSEPIETVRYLITQGSNSSVVFSLEGTLHIVDNDASPQFDTSIAYVREDVGQLEVCISFTAPSSVVVRSQLITVPLSAYGDADYVPIVTSFDIAGQTRQCHTIEILDDDVPEGAEAFKVILRTSNSQLPPIEMIIWITDNDYLEFEGNSTTYTVAENGTLELCVVFSGGNLTSTIRGYIITQPVTASRKDFNNIFQLIQLTETDRMCFNVTLVDDVYPEPREEFRVFLLTLDYVVHTEFVTVFIEDDDDGEYYH